MKRALLFLVSILLLNACQVDENFITTATINPVITTQYLLEGNLDVYLQNNQVFRYTGKPGIETIPIGVGNLSEYEECFVLNVSSGQDATTAVSSAIIKLDGMEVLNTSDFSNSSVIYKFEICKLLPQSVLEVEVRGEPGSYIDIWIEGKMKELTMTDCDGNVYETVKIGNQVWIAENLRTTKYCNGDQIINVTEQNEWGLYQSGSYCWYDNDISYKIPYGALYNWYTVVDIRKICPQGWHVPSDLDFKTLELYLGLPEAEYYNYSPRGETQNLFGKLNETGFNMLLGGYRAYAFLILGKKGFLWSTTESGDYDAIARQFHSSSSGIPRAANNKYLGFSVRCLKD